MVVEIDSRSGFCHGVVSAINKAEEELLRPDGSRPLYCLGDIVHNSDEVERLERKGLQTITHTHLGALAPGSRVLLRAHGEPPSTYITAARQGLDLIDATCPVVLQLQKRIRHAYLTSPAGTQIVIYGKNGHAEVNGLVGQTDGTAIVIEGPEHLDQLDFSKPIELYSQTTKSVEGFRGIIADINSRLMPGTPFNSYDTICRQVANRVDHLRQFAAAHDVVIFVSGAKSSNGRVLFGQCLEVNPRTHLVSSPAQLRPEWIDGAESVGICGATSTPRWLMEEVSLTLTRQQ